jgi:hypothetical protein
MIITDGFYPKIKGHTETVARVAFCLLLQEMLLL